MASSDDLQACRICLDWWTELEDKPGDRAVLRRAGTLNEVVFQPGFHVLRHKLKEAGWGNKYYSDRLAAIAGILAHVRNAAEERAQPLSLASAMGRPVKDSERSPLSGLRFRRLLQADSVQELFRPMIRAVRLLESHNVNIPVMGLSKDLYWWSDRVKRDWAFAYYDAAPSKEK